MGENSRKMHAQSEFLMLMNLKKGFGWVLWSKSRNTKLETRSMCCPVWYYTRWSFKMAEKLWGSSRLGEKRLFRTGGSKMSVAKVKFPDMESELLLKFKERRSHSRRCSANWIKTKAKQILEEKHSEDVFSTSHGWFCRFLKRFNLCPRKRSNTKQASVWGRIPFIDYFTQISDCFCPWNKVYRTNNGARWFSKWFKNILSYVA